MQVNRWSGSAPRRVLAVIAAVAVIAVVVAGVVVGRSVHEASPDTDAFYEAPASVPARPGRIVRSQPFAQGVPETARAWRILYTTTRGDGEPALGSAIVLVGKDAPPGPRPVVAWAHGTSGYDRSCAPSLMSQPFGTGIRQELDQLVRKHWLLVAPDYIGMGTAGPQPYLIGQGEGRAMLDAVRATRRFRAVSASDRTVVWGHSQGGGAALWTGQIQPAYAPDVPLAGVAAVSPTSDMPAIIRRLNGLRGGTLLVSYVLTAYAAAYPDVRLQDYVTPAAGDLVDELAGLCNSAAVPVVLDAADRGLVPPLLTRSPDDGALGRRLRQNTPTGVGKIPLLIAQGGADPLILASMQRDYARSLCAHGQRLDYREYPGRNHSDVLRGSAPLLGQLISWTEDRLAGRPAAGNCAELTARTHSR